MTPPRLAQEIVRRLNPRGVILEPCAGADAFVNALATYGEVKWCEIERGRDFFQWNERVDWIITNPPWSLFRQFLEHSLKLANHIAFLVTVNHWWTQCRCEMVTKAGFAYERLWLLDAPDTFQPTGFQLGMMLISRGYTGRLTVDRILLSQQLSIFDSIGPSWKLNRHGGNRGNQYTGGRRQASPRRLASYGETAAYLLARL